MIVLYDKVQLDTKYCQEGGAAAFPAALVEQSFSIKYKISTGSSNRPFYRSGSPGYKLGLPMLIAENGSGVKLVNSNGFKVLSGDKTGFCFATLDATDSVGF